MTAALSCQRSRITQTGERQHSTHGIVVASKNVSERKKAWVWSGLLLKQEANVKL